MHCWQIFNCLLSNQFFLMVTNMEIEFKELLLMSHMKVIPLAKLKGEQATHI